MSHHPTAFPANRLDVSDLPNDGFITVRLERVFHVALLVLGFAALLILLLVRVGAPR